MGISGETSPDLKWKISIGDSKYVVEGLETDVLVSLIDGSGEPQTAFNYLNTNSYWSPGPGDFDKIAWSPDSKAFTFPVYSKKHEDFLVFFLNRGKWVQPIWPKGDLEKILAASHFPDTSALNEQIKTPLAWSTGFVLKWTYWEPGAIVYSKIKLKSGIPTFECLSVERFQR